MGLERLLKDEASDSPNAVTAEVRRAPAEVGDELKVRVPSFATTRLYTVRHWSPRGAVLPEVGDQALIIFDETGEPWLVAFTPA